MPRRKSESLEEFQKKNLEKSLLRQQKQKEQETKNPRPRRKAYVKNSDLLAELVKWRDSNKDVSKRVPSEFLGKMILDIATHYMGHPDYVRYSKEIKEDIKNTLIQMKMKTHSFKIYGMLQKLCSVGNSQQYRPSSKQKKNLKSTT